MTSMSNCMIGVLKVTKCSEQYPAILERYENLLTSSPFCPDTDTCDD